MQVGATQAEAQIDKMQLNAYNSPGAELPVPPQVMASGISTLGAVWWVQPGSLRQHGAGAVFSLLLGAAVGVAALFILSTDDPSDFVRLAARLVRKLSEQSAGQ